jgi:hypothetical protein
MRLSFRLCARCAKPEVRTHVRYDLAISHFQVDRVKSSGRGLPHFQLRISGMSWP